MTEAAGSEAGNITVELELVAEVVSQQLESMLSVGQLRRGEAVVEAGAAGGYR
jgi:hypothetical protein